MASKTYEGYVIKSHPKFPAQKVVTTDGSGSIPKALEGMFTNFTVAMQAIDLYKISLEKKRKADASKADTATRNKQVRKGPDNGDGTAKRAS